jgi:hypothetical protein
VTRVPTRLGAALLLLLLVATPATAQRSEDVRLEVTLAPDSAARSSGPIPTQAPILRVRNLLADERWTPLLQSGFPLRLHFRVELWRERDVWFDDFRRQVEWDVIVRREPLLDQYTVATLTPATTNERRYASLEALGRALGYAYRIAIAPTDRGTFYYAGSVAIATLADSDLDELERFLEGDLSSAARGGERFGDVVGRGARRILLRLAGVPSMRLEARSVRFKVP